ncbi:TIM barrel protein [Candidatus Woesearchaeota archaeon]|nr:TIM barrel protein [Candidatus Woesearchaeota archaeon]MBW2994286.1 TIM barrel protein [Candidatus Woesearchaeota archaeon]
MKVLIGPGGIGSDYNSNFKRFAAAGLTCAEVEFTHSIYMKNNKIAKTIGDAAKKQKIDLSVHCPYYINLISADKVKIGASKKRIITSAERGHYLGAKYIVFHAGYYGKFPREEAYEGIKEAIEDMQDFIKEKKWKVKLAPEVMGKDSSFGTIDELYDLHKETKCAVCVDFAHLKAHYRGKIDWEHVMKTMKKFKFSPLTAHMSGIEWGPKGEQRHAMTQTKEIKEMLQQIKKHKLSIRIINESPDTFGDAVKTLKLYNQM